MRTRDQWTAYDQHYDQCLYADHSERMKAIDE